MIECKQANGKSAAVAERAVRRGNQKVKFHVCVWGRSCYVGRRNRIAHSLLTPEHDSLVFVRNAIRGGRGKRGMVDASHTAV